jgi:hypothetical protein
VEEEVKYSNEQIRAAILRAATAVEFDRANYRFREIKVGDCGTPMCMWGWIGRELGMENETFVFSVAKAMGLSERHLYNLVDFSNGGDIHNPETAANAMRKLANLYFPAPPVVLPAVPEKPAFNSAYLAFRSSLLRIPVESVS